MKTLIIFSSKYGYTADCSIKLKEELGGEPEVLDINEVKESPDISSYDTVIIGSSVYVGKVSKKIREFCKENLESLQEKQLGIFICLALVEEKDEILKTNFPSPMLDHVKAVGIFGGEARLDKMKFVDKKIINLVTKGDFSGFKKLDDNIVSFAQEMLLEN
jgi:menaquinone-dependent protoporphyrinogen oxidase